MSSDEEEEVSQNREEIFIQEQQIPIKEEKTVEPKNDDTIMQAEHTESVYSISPMSSARSQSASP